MKQDEFVVRVIVVAVAACVVGGVAFEGFLALTHTEVPDAFDKLITFLAGSVTTFLVNARGAADAAAPVTIMNDPTNAVPVTPTDPEPEETATPKRRRR